MRTLCGINSVEHLVTILSHLIDFALQHLSARVLAVSLGFSPLYVQLSQWPIHIQQECAFVGVTIFNPRSAVLLTKSTWALRVGSFYPAGI